MTRINVTPVQELPREQLSGEYVEALRPFSKVVKRVKKGQTPNHVKYPQDYVMGRGHETFFFNRLGYLEKRLRSVAAEMLARGYKPKLDKLEAFLSDMRAQIPPEWWGDYQPTDNALRLNRERIAERLSHPGHHHARDN